MTHFDFFFFMLLTRDKLIFLQLIFRYFITWISLVLADMSNFGKAIIRERGREGGGISALILWSWLGELLFILRVPPNPHYLNKDEPNGELVRIATGKPSFAVEFSPFFLFSAFLFLYFLPYVSPFLSPHLCYSCAILQ